MSATVIMLCYNVGEKYYLESADRFVVYNVNKSLAIDLFYGRKNTFIADENLVEDPDKLLFHVQHNWFFRTGNEQADKVIPLVQTNPVIQVGKETLCIINGPLLDSIPKTDIVYLERIDFVPNNLSDDWKTRKTRIILGNSLKRGVKNYLIKTIETNQFYSHL